MPAPVGDAGVFVRSLASRGHLGGLSRKAARVVDIMDAGPADVEIAEIAEIAHTKVVVASRATSKSGNSQICGVRRVRLTGEARSILS